MLCTDVRFDASICRRTHAPWRLELNTRFPHEKIKETAVICVSGRYTYIRSVSDLLGL